MAAQSEQLRKAAMLVAALDDATADLLLDRLDPNQAGLVRRVLVQLDDVEPMAQAEIVAEFVGCEPRGLDEAVRPAEVRDPEPVRYGAAAYGAAAYGAGIYSDAGRRVPAVDVPFRFLHEAPGEDLSDLLAGEHPQTVAVVLSHLPPQRAADAIAALSPTMQADVLRRLARLDETDAATLREVEDTLQRRFRNRFRDDSGRVAGVGAVQNILSEAAPDVRRTLLAGISRQDPELAVRLTKPTLPTLNFADLLKLADVTLRTLCDEADAEVLAVALAGADLHYTDRFVAVLPRVRGLQLRRAIDTLGPTRLSDVELCRANWSKPRAVWRSPAGWNGRLARRLRRSKTAAVVPPLRRRLKERPRSWLQSSRVTSSKPAYAVRRSISTT
ncbi:MAG: FliG C-terminal domain-containing protein [Pirellulales bacterium]